MTTSYEVRAEFEDLLERDLLGPWDGAEEELPPRTSPAERYLLGRLVPRLPPPPEEQADEPDDDDPSLVDREVMAADDPSEEDESESDAAVRSGSMAASAIGLAFHVPSDVHAIHVEAAWGRYFQAPSEVHETPTGKPARTWQRAQAGGAVDVPLDEEGLGDLVPDEEQPGVVVHYTVRHRGKRRTVELSLVNGQRGVSKTPDVARLYQVGMTVTASDGEVAIFLGHNDPEFSSLPADNDDERRHLELLNRERRQYVTGRQCAVDALVRDGERRAWKLVTTCFPSAEVQMVEPGKVPGLVLDMTRLGSAELGGAELARALRPLVTGYRRWLDEQSGRLSDPEIARYEPAGERAVSQARDVADRLERAIDMLRRNGIAREAFRFANQAMAQQRVRSEVVRARLSSPDADVNVLARELDKPENRSWRPFQLAFVLMCLPGLTDPAHPDAHRGVLDPGDAQVQLLFFPTGGGKTEAYLGLAAYTFAIRRLRQVTDSGEDAQDATRGVAVLMRYTLRLLTAQQFQRAAALVCACELLRRERVDSGDMRWGSTPFRIGLWVGKSVTPNGFDDAEREITQSRGYEKAIGGPLQLAACPWCGSRLSLGHDVQTSKLRRRVLVYCSDPEGECPFTPRQSPDEGLPVLTVDEEIYRLTPSLVIATVDKLAQLPWKAATATLFGLVETECDRHGWQNPDFESFCKSGGHKASGGLPAAQVRSAARLRPPDLVIQDELHLICDALGSMVGLYETAIDRLCTFPLDGHVVRPVLVASTATVRRAADQSEQVFARGLSVFPPPVLDAGYTFFSTAVRPSASTPGRRYRGVLAPGERLKLVEIRVVSALMEHAQYLLDRHGSLADPYMTVVDYFTSTRELAGMRRLAEDDVADRLASRSVRTRRRRPRVEELTGRMPSSKIAESLAELEMPFDPGLDSTAAMDEYRASAEARERSAASRDQPPVDILLATSMLQVGVDVQRLGLMVVTGQPKNTAEYIQATSRIGRDRRRPGVVVTIYNWTRPRDLAHYETFAYDHATFGLRVEGVTTTPFSDRALDRGLTGVLVTALRHSESWTLPNVAANAVPLSGPAVDELTEDIERRVSWVTHDQGRVEQVRQQLRHRLDGWQVRRRAVRTGRLGYEVANDVTGLLRDPDAPGWDLWSAPLSLREVEQQIILQLDRDDHSLSEEPEWSYDR